jgi:hypothetical protein
MDPALAVLRVYDGGSRSPQTLARDAVLALTLRPAWVCRPHGLPQERTCQEPSCPISPTVCVTLAARITFLSLGGLAQLGDRPARSGQPGLSGLVRSMPASIGRGDDRAVRIRRVRGEPRDAGRP